MANAEQIAILKKGVAAWNEWRITARDVSVDFRGADLSRTNLHGVSFGKADLSRAKLSDAYLFRADLSEANLQGADLVYTNLSLADLGSADLTGANLMRAYLSETNLRNANLSQAYLPNATLIGAALRATSFVKARLSNTTFSRVSLSLVDGLDTCDHQGPSSLDYHTLMASGPLPEVFLRGCGLPDDYIHYLASFRSQPFEFYSCFISYSHDDKNFARRLHDALQGRGIRCWLDEHQLLPGDLVHRAVDEGIRLWDKVLLCASEASLTSWWVDKEIRKALAKEEQLWKERKKEVLALIPLNLDGFMFHATWTDWKQEHLTSRLAADFTGWKNDDDKFNAQLERVIKALRADGRARERAPEAKL
jgi:hypothetical protein